MKDISFRTCIQVLTINESPFELSEYTSLVIVNLILAVKDYGKFVFEYQVQSQRYDKYIQWKFICFSGTGRTILRWAHRQFPDRFYHSVHYGYGNV